MRSGADAEGGGCGCGQVESRKRAALSAGVIGMADRRWRRERAERGFGTWNWGERGGTLRERVELERSEWAGGNGGELEGKCELPWGWCGAVVRWCVRGSRKERRGGRIGQDRKEGSRPVLWTRERSGEGTRKALMRRENCTLQLDAGRYCSPAELKLAMAIEVSLPAVALEVEPGREITRLGVVRISVWRS